MAISYEVAEHLFKLRSYGYQFGNVLTLGRQKLCVAPKDIARLARKYLHVYNKVSISDSEQLLTFLGATRIVSVDKTEKEGATCCVDLNAPGDWDIQINQFDTIIDCGTLEHIFNAPLMLRCIARNLKVRAAYIGAIPANGYYGHGFYQFSSEFWFRLFNKQDYKVDVQSLSFGLFGRKLYSVTDPKSVGVRATYLSSRPTLHIVTAQRIANVSQFNSYPIQSDYQNTSDIHDGEFEKPLHILHILFPRLFEYLYNTFFISNLNPLFWRNKWK